MNLKPLNDRIILQRIEGETKTAGGLFIPDSAKEKPQEALVVAVGEGKLLENGKVRPLEVKKGDRVYFRKYAGNEITVDGKEYIILREEEILAVFA